MFLQQDQEYYNQVDKINSYTNLSNYGLDSLGLLKVDALDFSFG